MYIPKHFHEEDLVTLQTFIQEHLFATVITQVDGRPVASHIPLTFDPQQGSYGTLAGHVALGNQQWKTLDGSQEVFVIFQGPHAYVSASWYEDPSKNVPTWNYAVVHAYGVAKRMGDEELFEHLAALTQVVEAGARQPWSFDPATEYVQRLLHGIVGFTITITSLDGKFKLNQNRTAQDRERVIAVLRDATDTPTSEIATLMQAQCTKNV